MRELRDPNNGTLYGRACIYPTAHYLSKAGAVTVGGFRATEISGIAGLLVGESLTVSRDSAIPTVPAGLLREWASEQARVIAELNLSDAERQRTAVVVLALGGDATPLPIAVRDGGYLSAVELEDLFHDLEEVVIYGYDEISHEDDDDVTRRRFNDGFEVVTTLFLVPDREPVLVSAGERRWPGCLDGLFTENQPRTCLQRFVQLLSQAWQDRLEQDSDFRKVGEVDDYEITRSVTIFRREHVENDEDPTTT